MSECFKPWCGVDGRKCVDCGGMDRGGPRALRALGIPRLDTRELGPIRVEPTKTPERTAFARWWSMVCRRGDPLRQPNLVDEAFTAGWAAAERHAKDHPPVSVPSLWRP